MLALGAKVGVFAPFAQVRFGRSELLGRFYLFYQLDGLVLEGLELLRGPAGDDVLVEGEVVPDEPDVLGIGPFALNGHLINGQLAVGVGVLLAGQMGRGLVVVDAVDVVLALGQPVDVAGEFVLAVGVEGEVDPDFGTDGQVLVEGGVAPVVGLDELPAQLAVVLGRELFLGDKDGVGPVGLPLAVVEGNQFLEGIELGVAQVVVAFFQGVVDSGADEGFDALFFFALNAVDVAELVFERALFVGGQARIGICGHGLGPF